MEKDRPKDQPPTQKEPIGVDPKRGYQKPTTGPGPVERETPNPGRGREGNPPQPGPGEPQDVIRPPQGPDPDPRHRVPEANAPAGDAPPQTGR